MQLKEVKNQADWHDFHAVSYYIYAKDPHWIAPLEDDVRKVFTSENNKAFQEGKARLWVLYNDNKPIGRIAAFIDRKRNEELNTKDGGIGFFECVNNKKAANMLFEVAEQYLSTEGMTSIDAPINFGERDKFWGLLIKGWAAPLYQENYHPFYYRAMIESRGYQPHEQIFTFGGDLQNIPIERNLRLATMVRKRYGIQSRAIRKNDLKNEAHFLADVYNAAFADKPHFKHITGKQFYQMIKPLKPVMDPKLIAICFAGQQAVGFCALMPDLNQALKFAKGKLSWWKLPLFFYKLKKGKHKTVKGVAFGIHPDFRNKGVFPEMANFMSLVDDRYNIRTYSTLGLATIRGGNYKMLKSTAASLNVQVNRVHLSYQKRLDDSPYSDYKSTDTTDVAWGDIPDVDIYPTA